MWKIGQKWAEKFPNCMRGGNPRMRFEDLSRSEAAIRGATLLKFWRIFCQNLPSALKVGFPQP
jgi:hypothetical protein